MKYLTVLLLCFVVALNCERSAEDKKIFRDWIQEHKKQYKSHAEEIAAFERFLKNKEEIDAHNKLYDEGKVSYQRGLQPHSDLSDEEFVKQMLGGGFQQGNRNKRAAPAIPAPKVPEGPKEVDWKAKGLVGPIKPTQNPCGCCWAFAVTGIVEAFLRKQDPSNTVSLSEQNLEDCSDNFGCGGGGFAINGLNYIKENGIASRKDYPYFGYDRQCEYNKSMSVTKLNKTYDVELGGDENVMKNIIAKYGPVAIGICVDKAFQHFKGSGVYDNPNCCRDTLGGHIPMVYGYGTDSKHGDYWLVKNSWGPIWAEGGFGKIKRGVNICGITNNPIQYAS